MSDPRMVVLDVSGMTCNDCAIRVKAALEEAGVHDVSVSWRSGEARFSWPPEISEAALSAAVRGAGYLSKAVHELEPSGAVSSKGEYEYDFVAIGAGSAAFAAAIKASEGGYRVALIEDQVIGGTCVNKGCIPSKALLKAGELAWEVGHHPFSGLATELRQVDLPALVAQKKELVGTMRQEKYIDLVADYGFELIKGFAAFTGPDSVQVNSRIIKARVFLIATGASPGVPAIPGLANSGYLTSETALELTDLPQRLVVLGASAIGLELGQFFLHLGSKVTFIDLAESIAPLEEPEVSAALAAILIEQGASIRTSASILDVHLQGNERVVRLRTEGNDFEVTADQVLVAAGRYPKTSGLGLEEAGVATDSRGAIIVDDEQRTSNPRVFAAGDVCGSPQFVYVAAYQGALAVDNALLGMHRKCDFTGLPRVTFTMPQIASAGLTEAKAREEGFEVVTSVLPLDAVPRALVNRDVHGVVKLVAEVGTSRILGASLVADGAGDAIQAAVLAIKYGLTVDDLASTFHPYLTMAEGLKLAAQTFTRDVHRLSCCAV
ncbi:MAG: mercury(II) reductase [Actinomycetota bacterium]|nr:mercury(II) reductase [Actinomycetota bacterium]